jgi:hypothetical protein
MANKRRGVTINECDYYHGELTPAAEQESVRQFGPAVHVVAEN